MSNFAEILRRKMFEQRLKAVDLAKGTKIAPSVISRYLSGQNQPSRDNIITIGNYLDTHPQSLLSSSDASESTKKSQVISSPLLMIIEVQNKLIKNLENRSRHKVITSTLCSRTWKRQKQKAKSVIQKVVKKLKTPPSQKSGRWGL